jgi:hypothetical protein
VTLGTIVLASTAIKAGVSSSSIPPYTKNLYESYGTYSAWIFIFIGSVYFRLQQQQKMMTNKKSKETATPRTIMMNKALFPSFKIFI